MASRGFLGAGNLYMARFVGGVLQPREGPFECNKFSIKPNVEIKELTSKGRDTYGQVVESTTIAQPADLEIELTEVNKESLAIAMLGTVAVLNQASGTLTDEPIVIATLNQWYPASKANWTGNPTVEHTSGSPAYVEGTDYIVDKQMGWIKALPGGAIAAAQTVHLTTTYAASKGYDIKGMTDAQLRVRFWFAGKNQADGLQTMVTVYEAVIAADSEFDFLQDDFGTVTLPGRMKTPAGFTEPFLIRTLTE